MADRLVLATDLYPVSPSDAPQHQPDQLQLLTNIVQQLASQVQTLSVAAAPTKPTTSAIPTADFDRAAGGRRELDALPADSTNTPLEYIDPREWSEFASRTFTECLPPSGTTAPCLWNPRHDEADNCFTHNARISSRDEYRHMLCYGVFTAAANSALETAMETIRSVTSTPDETAYAYSLVNAALRTHQAVASAGEARLSYIMRFKAKKILTGEERVAERLVYTRCVDTVASDRGGNVVSTPIVRWTGAVPFSQFTQFDTQFGPHTIDRFASALKSQHATAPVQRKLARPVVRSSGLPSTRRYVLAKRKQLVQPVMALATRPRPRTTAKRRSSHSGRPPLAGQSVAPCPYRVGVPRESLAGPHALVPSREAARTRYNRQASLTRQCLPDSLSAWLYLRRGAVTATLTMFNTQQIRPPV
jgi:hypothetical protein